MVFAFSRSVIGCQVDIIRSAAIWRLRSSRFSTVGYCALPTIWVLLIQLFAANASRAVESERCVVVEVYYHSKDASSEEILSALAELKSSRGGIIVVRRVVDTEPRNRERLDVLLRHFKMKPNSSPVVYGCNRIVHDFSRRKVWTEQLQEMLQVEVFVRAGCSHCAEAKRWIPTFRKEYPGLDFVYRDIAMDPGHAARLSAIVKRHRTAAASVPVFHVCDRLFVGFESPAATGDRLRNALKMWTQACEPPDARPVQPAGANKLKHGTSMRGRLGKRFPFAPVLAAVTPSTGSLLPEFAVMPQVSKNNGDGSLADQEELPLPITDDTPDIPLPVDSASDRKAAEEYEEDQIEVPVLGRLSATKLGMPVFTLVIGLVDGFNPCAMWVLLFLLSILVNLKDRKRILAIAATFVVVSGLAYFAFMAAWLNVFMLIGYLRPIQISLAVVAMFVGIVHIKDFFAFRKGFSLSIPESAKPGLYARVRKIVTAERLMPALAGAFVLAVLVNIIELLCTAGLPALYTNILSQQGFSSAIKYAYLTLYILAYIFDDSLMVGVVVLTLSRKKFQESHGRWLKLISGTVIVLLGVIMLFRPEWLQ